MIEFAKIFIPVAASLIVLLIAGGVKLRDMILRQNREIEWLQKDLKDLESKRDKDLVEHNTLKTMAASMDAKIDSKLTEVIRELANQRHHDLMIFKDAIFALEKNFSNTLSDIRETLVKFNGTLESLGKEVERVKDEHTHNR